MVSALGHCRGTHSQCQAHLGLASISHQFLQNLPCSINTSSWNKSTTVDFQLLFGASLYTRGILFWYSYRQPNPAYCTGTHFHSPLPGSGWQHCDVTPNAEKGAAHLPCYQNNTLADNYWTAFKHFCLHTSKNALDCGLHEHGGTTPTKPSPAAQENPGPGACTLITTPLHLRVVQHRHTPDKDLRSANPWCV